MKKAFYKPKTLAIGLFLFGVCLFAFGVLSMISVKDGITDIKDILYTITFTIAIIGMIIGQIYIMDASSYDVNKEIKNE